MKDDNDNNNSIVTENSSLIKDYEPSTRGATSEKIITEFLNSNKDIGKVDIELTGKTTGNVYASLRSYIERHNIPATVRQENGNVILERNQETDTT